MFQFSPKSLKVTVVLDPAQLLDTHLPDHGRAGLQEFEIAGRLIEAALARLRQI